MTARADPFMSSSGAAASAASVSPRASSRPWVSVAVYERDRTPTSREQGYRVHIDPTGSWSSTNEFLPPVLGVRLRRHRRSPGTSGFGFLTERLRTLVLVEDEIFGGGLTDPVEGHHAVSRITLRQILLAGLEGRGPLDKEGRPLRAASRRPGTTGAVFADGRRGDGGPAGRRGRRQLARPPPVPAEGRSG